MATLKNSGLSFPDKSGGNFDFKIAFIKIGQWDVNTSGTSGNIDLTDYITGITRMCAIFIDPYWHVATVETSTYDNTKVKYTITSSSGPGWSVTRDIMACVIYY